MSIDVLFAGVAVADLDTALAWYDRLLGRQADIVVNEGEVMWRIASAAWLYVVADPDRAGRALVTLAVADLDKTVGQIKERGISEPPIETLDAGRKASFTDPDGSRISFIEVKPATA